MDNFSLFNFHMKVTGDYIYIHMNNLNVWSKQFPCQFDLSLNLSSIVSVSEMFGTRSVSDFGIFAYAKWAILGMGPKSHQTPNRKLINVSYTPYWHSLKVILHNILIILCVHQSLCSPNHHFFFFFFLTWHKKSFKVTSHVGAQKVSNLILNLYY